MANKRRSIDRSLIQVALILFQIGPICSVLNFWDQRPCRCMETCMLHRRVIYQPYIFKLIRCRQLTFCCFLSQINTLALTRSSGIHILIYFDLKSRFLTYALHEMKVLLVFKRNSTALPSGLNVKSTFLPILTSNLVFWAYALREMKFLFVFKSNQQPCHQALTWNQHSNLFWPQI